MQINAEQQASVLINEVAVEQPDSNAQMDIDEVPGESSSKRKADDEVAAEGYKKPRIGELSQLPSLCYFANISRSKIQLLLH
jgi:hypothetical protein